MIVASFPQQALYPGYHFLVEGEQVSLPRSYLIPKQKMYKPSDSFGLKLRKVLELLQRRHQHDDANAMQRINRAFP